MTTAGSGLPIKSSLKLLQFLLSRTGGLDSITQTVHRGKGTSAPRLSKLPEFFLTHQSGDKSILIFDDDYVVSDCAKNSWCIRHEFFFGDLTRHEQSLPCRR